MPSPPTISPARASISKRSAKRVKTCACCGKSTGSTNSSIDRQNQSRGRHGWELYERLDNIGNGSGIAAGDNPDERLAVVRLHKGKTSPLGVGGNIGG